MNCNIKVSEDFAREAKRLAKKYPSFKKYYADFLENIVKDPLQGDEITLKSATNMDKGDFCRK